jgi:hypothetical protein
MTHTPGPWYIHTLNGRIPIVRRIAMPYGEAPTFGSTIRSQSDADHHVCVLDFGYGCENDEANARLIAAAPDLLAACEDFVRNCPACGGSGELKDVMISDGLSPAGLCVWCQRHRAAIEKAKAAASPAEPAAMSEDA